MKHGAPTPTGRAPLRQLRGGRSSGAAAGAGRVHPHSPIPGTFPRQRCRQQAPHRHGRGDGCEGSHKNDLRGWRD